MSKLSEDFFKVFMPSQNIILNRKSNTLSIDLGSGANPANPFNATSVKGIDIIQAQNIIQVDLFFHNLPIQDESIDYISAFDFFEHVPRGSSAQTTKQDFAVLC